ncbi:hypothetical protein BC938DRAFT_482467 [Jimgerdemannia flammicorona]|uniref:Uncharacterized protein n=1 Tax=Jimgerdemannia flammicorona TaxID=994334 RepID=A0A433QDW1_9FUNG|nr:hypothetical protein BC938DRAFT_482467 [Jimgerdemannia flammicorona]
MPSGFDDPDETCLRATSLGSSHRHIKNLPQPVLFLSLAPLPFRICQRPKLYRQYPYNEKIRHMIYNIHGAFPPTITIRPAAPHHWFASSVLRICTRVNVV